MYFRGSEGKKLDALLQDDVLAEHNLLLVNYSESRWVNTSNIRKASVRLQAPENATTEDKFIGDSSSLVPLLKKPTWFQ